MYLIGKTVQFIDNTVKIMLKIWSELHNRCMFVLFKTTNGSKIVRQTLLKRLVCGFQVERHGSG